LVKDSMGIAFGLWEARERAGAELVNVPGTWAMSSLHTLDVERARAFYGALFDWELERLSDASFSLWRLSGEIVAVVSSTDGATVPPHWSVNFAVPHADAIAEHATELGGTLVMPPFDTPGFRNAVISDPQGGVIALSAPAAA
jgi:predicted enzyme related to lactoylglutathione lyase